MGEDDVLFRIGFEDHPESRSRLESLAKSVEATQARISKAVEATGAKAIAQMVAVRQEAMKPISASLATEPSARQSVVNSPSPAARRPSASPTSSGGSPTSSQSMVPIHRTEVEQIMRDDARLRAQQEANNSARAKSEQAYTDRSAMLSQVRQVAMEEEAATVRAGVQQIQRDLELLSNVKDAGGASALGITESQVSEAKLRVLKVFDATKEAEEAATAIAIKEQKARQEANRQSAREAGLRVQAEIAAEKKAAEEGRKSLMQRLELHKKAKAEAKAAADASIREAERERVAAVKAVQAVAREREKMHKESQASARAAATPLIEQYAKEEQTARQALGSIKQARGQLLESVLSSGEAVGKLARGAVLLGVAEGDELAKVMAQLAKVQAAIDISTGSIQIIRNIAKGMEALRTITVATKAAKMAENAQTRIAIASSGALTTALQAEALSATAAARAHAILGAARGGKGGAVGAVADVATTGAKRGILGRALGGAGSLLGMGGGGAATVTGGGAAATGATALATLAAAAVGAAAGLGMAGKGAFDLFQNFQKNGLRSNAEKGSYADVVGGSKFNPFSALIAWSERANLKQEEEQTARMTAQSVLIKLEAEHQKNLANLEIDSLYERNKNAKDLELSFAMERVNQLRDPDKKRGAADTVLGDLTNAVSARKDAVKGFERTDLDTGKTFVDLKMVGAAKAVAELEDAQSRLNETVSERIAIEKELQDESRKSKIEEIRGIEDVIRKRQEERTVLEDSLKSAKERFGELSAIEQAQAIKTLEKARAGQQLTKKDLSRLDQLGTDESKSFASQSRIKNAEAAGFDRADVGRNERMGIADKDKAINQGLDDLAAKSGQSRADLAKRSETTKIEIVDQTQFQLKLDLEAGAIFERLANLIQDGKRDMNETLDRKLQAALVEMQDSEKAAYKLRVSEANAG
jgi:hypothetical protein